MRYESKRELRRRIAELEERLAGAKTLTSRYLDALEPEELDTKVRILDRVHGEPPKAER